jgi:redox-sensitive bicupin YhaK (pirin superfamily)
MLIRRPAAERGHANHGWLDSHHTFSFANYHDPRYMGFRSLRVINDDRVDAGAGFPTHPHRDMEIVSYVVEGALEHKDSMGNGSVIRPGDVQRMSAGTGVRHSEYNHSKQEGVRFLQIWIQPDVRGIEPGYEQKNFKDERRSNLCLVASPDGQHDSVRLRQDARIYASELKAGETVTHSINKDRHVWLQIIDGSVTANHTALGPGDGAALSEEASLTITADESAHFLLFDLA